MTSGSVLKRPTSCGLKADVDDLEEFVFMEADLLRDDADPFFGPEKADQHEDRAEHLADHSRKRRPVHVHFEEVDEYDVQQKMPDFFG